MAAALSGNNVAPHDGLERLRGAIVQAIALAGQIERGQAQMPLSDHFATLNEALDSAPLALTLLGLDVESRAAALGWLCGEEFRVLRLEVPGSAGLVEVQLAERGYVLINAGLRQEFDRLKPFLQAVRAADLVRQGDADTWLEPMQLEVAAPRGLQGLRLLMPESPAALAENPALLARLRAEANMLAVVGPADQELDGAAAEAIHALAADALATWAITCGTPPITSDLGWSALLGGGTLPSVHLGPGTDPHPIPAFLQDGLSGVRRGLFGCQQALRFETALDMLEERVQQDVRQQTSRRKALLRRSAALGELGQDRALREASETIRREVGELVARLETQQAESHRERLLPAAFAGNTINNLLEDLAVEDLAKEGAGRVVHVSVAPEALKKAEQRVRDLVHPALRDDLGRLRPALEELERNVRTKLAALGDGELPIRLETLDETNLWEALRKTIHLDPRYRGELYQKGKLEGAFELAMHARKPLFLIMMTAPILFPFLSDPRKQLAPVMLPLLIGGVVWAVHSLRAEHQEKIEREVIRLRDTLGSEIRGRFEQTLRDWQTRVILHLREVDKKVGREVEERLKALMVQQGSQSARERAEIQDKLRVVDNRLRELGGLVQQVGRVRQAGAEARQTLERATRDAQNELRQPAKVT